MFSWYKYLIINLVFSHLGFWSGNLFLIAPFPDLCLLVLFHPVSVTETSSVIDIEDSKSTEAGTVLHGETDWDKDLKIELDYVDTNSDGQSVSSDSEEDARNKEAEVDLTLGRIQRKRTEPAKVLAPKRRNVSTEGVGTMKARQQGDE